MTLKYAYTTLLTRSSYLAGVIILAHTLHKQSTYPLYVLYTSTLDASSVRALELESNKTKLIPLLTLPLLPNSSQPISLIAERFADTWTKLRVFEALADKGLGKVCYLDADMLITGPIDDVFAAADLPDENWIAANHVCCCNLDADEWADADWTPENCPYTPLSHPAALTTATPVTEEARETYHLLNGGQFVFQPSPLLWTRILDSFNTSVNLAAYKFPDQDFLAAFFRNRFLPLPWRFNALKTMRYWHPNIWRDECVVCVHYIVDKPWAARVASDGRAGYVGKDGETHKWWWEAFGAWKQEREGQKVRDLVTEVVAGEDGEEREALRAVGSKVQAFAVNKVGDAAQQPDDGKSEDAKIELEDTQAYHLEGGIADGGPRPVIRKLGGTGHGPVVHPNRVHRGGLINPQGRSWMEP